jgi:hypothetical protein
MLIYTVASYVVVWLPVIIAFGLAFTGLSAATLRGVYTILLPALALYHTERKTPDFSPGDISESLFVVYVFSTVEPTEMHAGGVALTPKLPTNVSDGHRGLRLVWFAVFGPGIPWLQSWGRSNCH